MLSSFSDGPLPVVAPRPSSATQRLRAHVGAALARPAPDVSRIQPSQPPRRSRLWDVSPSLHCSVIGTCLTPAELRQIFIKLDDADGRRADDHYLHKRGVMAAGRHDLAGKLLNKALDKRHEGAIRRFAKAQTPIALAELWREARTSGDIPGAYWALLTHPLASRELANEAFGDIHMLSHMLGSTNRQNLVRIRALEEAQAARDDKISRQEQRLRAAATERQALQARVAQLEQELRSGRLDRVTSSAAVDPIDANDLAALRQRLADERHHAAELADRLRATESALAVAETRAADEARHVATARRELANLEAVFAAPAAVEASARPRLTGICILYVGGRPQQVGRLARLVADLGGRLLAHDGGVEDNLGLLPGLVAQADEVHFPVDCISHAASDRVKKLCRDGDKPYRPLRTGGVGCFLAALNGCCRPDHDALALAAD